MLKADKAELRRLCKAGDTRSAEQLAQLCGCSPATVKRYRRNIKPRWYVDRTRGKVGFPFAVCALPRGHDDVTVVLGCFAYRPHAECALTAIKAAEEAGEFIAQERRGKS